jgi:hypothetical protein
MMLLLQELAARRALLEPVQMQEQMMLLVRRLAIGLQYEPISAETLRPLLDGRHPLKAIHNRQHIVVYIG